MGETLRPVTAGFNRSLSIETRAERLTGDPGAVLLREALDATGIIGWMAARMKDRRRQVDVVHDLPSLLRTMVLLIAQGWQDHDDADALRHDPATRLATGSSAGLTPLTKHTGLASQPTLSRCTAMLAEPSNLKVLREAALELAGRNLRAENGGQRRTRMTLDVDSLPLEVHGHQPKAEWNGHYRTRINHPLVTSIAETGDMLDAWLRPGNVGTAEGALDVILDVVDRAEASLCKITTVRIDAGFPSGALLSGLEKRGIHHVARRRANAALDRLAAPHMKRPPGRRPDHARGAPGNGARHESPLEPAPPAGTRAARRCPSHHLCPAHDLDPCRNGRALLGRHLAADPDAAPGRPVAPSTLPMPPTG